MNNISRRHAVENEQPLRGLAAKVSGILPAMRSKSSALSNVGNLCRPPLHGTNNKTSAIERQRANAEKLSKGYSVVNSKTTNDKENAVRPSVRGLGKENSISRTSIAPTARSTLQNFRSASQTSLKSERGTFRVPAPAKPVKEKKTGPLSKCQSVMLLPPVVPVLKVEDVVVSDIAASLEGLFVDEDKKYEHDEFQLGIYAKDIFKYLKQLEANTSVRPNYITTQHIMTVSMRSVLVDWMFEVQESFGLCQDTIQIAIALLDRFMQNNARIRREDLQLVGVSCLFIAAKYEEMYPPGATDLEHMSADACTKQQILRMEQRIFHSVEFNMGRPTPIQFLRRFGKIAGVNPLIYTLAKYIVDLALVQYRFSYMMPSELAASALYLVLSLEKDSPPFEQLWTPKLTYFSEYTAEALAPNVFELADLLLKAAQLKEKCVQRIYSQPKKYHSVSLLSEAKLSKLRELVARKR